MLIQPVDHSPSHQQQHRSFKSLIEGKAWLQESMKNLHNEGYLTASVDSFQVSDTLLRAWVYKGRPYKWARLSFSRLPEMLFDASGLLKADWSGQQVRPGQLAELREKLLRWCDNHGYPFAKLWMDSVQIDQEGITAQLVVEPGIPVRIHEISMHTEMDIAPAFLFNHLGIHPGDLYNEALLRDINKRLMELPYLKSARPWKMDFALDKNTLHLYLEPQKSNQLNGLIGLQPNTEETGKFLLTADIQLALQNTLGYGETLQASYENLQYKSPRFNFQLIAPYLFGTPFGLEGSFDLYKKDSTFRRTAFTLGLRYQFRAQDYLKVFYTHLSNRLISPDTQHVRLHNTLPDDLDLQTKGLGLGLEMNRTDYSRNPGKGWQLSLSAAALIRNVIPNDAITEMPNPSGDSYVALYEAANAEKQQYRLTASLGWYLRLFKSTTLHLRYNGGYLSGESLFRNERFQIGGFSLLRGFDEQSLFVNRYHIATAELRFILAQQSVFYLFSDNAFTYAAGADFKKTDFPVSFGAGLQLQNENGIFHIALGLGKHSGELFEFKKARIHFGYIAYF